MDAGLRRLAAADRQPVIEFALRAWAPVFASFEQVLGPAIYQRIFPDWLAIQRAAIQQAMDTAGDEADGAWVVERGGAAVGFMTLSFHDESHGEPLSGEIEMIAVDPEHQRQGIATVLIAHATQLFRDAGCRLAVIATGGDPGHAPARAAYEKAGYTPLPQARYYLAL